MTQYQFDYTETNRVAPPMVHSLSSNSTVSHRSVMSSDRGCSEASSTTTYHSYPSSPSYQVPTFDNNNFIFDHTQYSVDSYARELEELPGDQWQPIPPRDTFTNSYFTTDYESTAYYPVPDNTVHTFSSLGWARNTPLLNLYEFVSHEKDGYFELKDAGNASPSRPLKFYLTDPDLPAGPGPFVCNYPADIPNTKNKTKKYTCDTQFKRPADLQRHYKQVHTPMEKRVTLICDRGRCSRKSNKPFGRKDHLRDHLRDYHHEDLGKATRKDGTSDSDQAIIQSEWVDGRLINSKRWRCIKCLRNNKVSHGWSCEDCRMVCEVERQLSRLKLAEEEVGRVKEEAKPSTEELGNNFNCNTCKGSGIYEGASIGFDGTWDQRCPDCHPDCTPHFDTAMDYMQDGY